MFEGIDHVNFVVEDMDSMTTFYRDVIGMEEAGRATIQGDWIEQVVGLEGVEGRVVLLSSPDGPRIELIEYVTPAGHRPPGLGESNTMGFRHLAFRVGDIDAACAKLRGAGVEFFSEVQDVPYTQVKFADGVRKRLVYFRDPEGNLLELCEYRQGGG